MSRTGALRKTALSACLAGFGAAATGCPASSPQQVVCANDDQCVIDGVVGTCEAVGFCSVPNDGCPSGKAFAGSGNCVPEQSDSGDGNAEETEAGTESESESAGDEGEGMVPDPDMGPQCGQAIGSCDKLDVLIVVDNSRSIVEDAENVLPLLGPDVIESFVDLPCDYHVGVVTLDPTADWQPEACRIRGALSTSGSINMGQPCYGEDHPPYITNEDDPSLLFCTLATNGQFSSDEKQMRTMLDALSPELNAEGACNEGFLRDDAALVVLLITDEDDDDDAFTMGEDPDRTGSPGGPMDWFEELASIKEIKRFGIIEVLHRGDAECPWMPLPGTPDGTGSEYAQNILLFNAFITGASFPDHAATLEICADPNEVATTAAEKMAELVEAVCADSGL